MKTHMTQCAIMLLFLLNGILCYAQETIQIKTKPKATLYNLSDYEFSRHKEKRQIVSLSERKEKVLKKSQYLQVCGYTNYDKKFDFDTYIVAYKDKRWILRKYDVIDNTPINSHNSSIHDQYAALKRTEQEAYNEADSVLSVYVEICKDSLNYYRSLKERIPFLKDSIENTIKTRIQDELNADFNIWYNKQSKSVKRAASLLRISTSELQGADYAGGCDYHLYFTNMSKKTIKYLRWSGTVYNRVNDPVYCDIRGTSHCSGEYDGPVESGDEAWGAWGCVIYNYSADTIKLDHISIDYLDGTCAYISSTDIRALVNAPSTNIRSLLNKDMFLIHNARETIMSTEQCEEKIEDWEKEIRRTITYKEKIINGDSKYSDFDYYVGNLSYQQNHPQFAYLRGLCETARTKRITFEEENFM